MTRAVPVCERTATRGGSGPCAPRMLFAFSPFLHVKHMIACPAETSNASLPLNGFSTKGGQASVTGGPSDSINMELFASECTPQNRCASSLFRNLHVLRRRQFCAHIAGHRSTR